MLIVGCSGLDDSSDSSGEKKPGMAGLGGLCAGRALDHFKLYAIVNERLRVLGRINPFDPATKKVKNDFHSLPLVKPRPWPGRVGYALALPLTTRPAVVLIFTKPKPSSTSRASTRGR